MTELRLPDFHQSYAVLIGTGSYKTAKLDDLPGAVRNLDGIRDIISDSGLSGFLKSHVKLIRDPEQADDIMNPIGAVGGEATDVLLVYYSGHGLLMGENSDLYVCLTQSRPQAPWSALPFSYLANEIKQSEAKTKILIMDCCYSGRARTYLMSDEAQLVGDQLSAEGLYVMTSASSTKRSKAPPDAEYTAFTGELIQAARQGIASNKQLLSMTTLFEEVRRRMRATPWPLPEQCNTNNAADLALIRNAAYSPEAKFASLVQPLDFTRSRAVLIGVGHYEDRNHPDLPGSINATHAMRELLLDQSVFGFSPENCLTLIDPVGPRDYSRVLKSAEDAEDLLIFYYSGHGHVSERNELLLATTTWDPQDRFSSVSFRDIASSLERSRASNIVMIIDTSFSGRASSALTEMRGTIYLLAACGPYEMAFAGPGEHTSFTGSILKVLRHGISGAQIHLTPIDLFGALSTAETESGARPQLTVLNARNLFCLLRNRADEIDSGSHVCQTDK